MENTISNTTKHTITTETATYNERRYGRPWIAAVEFADNGDSKFDFGNWTGSPGDKGVLTIIAATGTILAEGQRDHRTKDAQYIKYYLVNPDGTLEELGNKCDAYKYHIEKKQAEPDMTALEAEKKSLLGRIAEIDKILNADK